MDESAAGYLTGNLLIAMPQMEDPRFARTVIYLCAHTSEGAMGLVVNKLMDSVAFPDLLDQLKIDTGGDEGGCDLTRAGDEFGRVLPHCDRVQVNDAINTVEIILQPNEVANRA